MQSHSARLPRYRLVSAACSACFRGYYERLSARDAYRVLRGNSFARRQKKLSALLSGASVGRAIGTEDSTAKELEIPDKTGREILVINEVRRESELITSLAVVLVRHDGRTE